jgi:hypothetical protein
MEGERLRMNAESKRMDDIYKRKTCGKANIRINVRRQNWQSHGKGQLMSYRRITRTPSSNRAIRQNDDFGDMKRQKKKWQYSQRLSASNPRKQNQNTRQ